MTPDAAERLDVLRPKPSPVPLIRIGGHRDGAYLVPDDLLGIRACFSPGVSNRKDFEDELLERFGIGSHMCDYSSDPERFRTPLRPGQTFLKKWLDVDGNEECVSLQQWVQEMEPDSDGDLMLQMDIEGAEYRNLLHTPAVTLQRFRILLVELHGLDAWLAPERFEKEIAPLLDLLDQHFCCVHAHPNNCCGDFQVPGSNRNLPRVHELTFLRRDRWAGVSDDDLQPPLLPHPLDIVCNTPQNAPVVLNEHWLESGERPKGSIIKLLTDKVSYLEHRLQEHAQHEYSLVAIQRMAQRAAASLPPLRQRPEGAGLADLAAGQPFVLSSVHPACPSPGIVQERQPFFFHTGKGHNQWITIDLERPALLFELHIRNRADACFRRARLLCYAVHDDAQPDLEQGLPVVIEESFLIRGGVSVTNLRGARGRHLTVFSPENTFLHLSAIKVLGITP
ncbi:MAG: hypothetical protein AAFX65_13800 [Cyanobacteria bacterium J06638_7]